MRFLRVTYAFLLALVIFTGLVFALWLSMLSANFMRVTNIEYDREAKTITLSRTVLGQDNVHAHWYVTVGNEGSAEECSADGVDIFEPYYPDKTPKTRVTVPAAPTLIPCLERDRAFISGAWMVLWKGILPLRPTYFFKNTRDPGQPL